MSNGMNVPEGRIVVLRGEVIGALTPAVIPCEVRGRVIEPDVVIRGVGIVITGDDVHPVEIDVGSPIPGSIGQLNGVFAVGKIGPLVQSDVEFTNGVIRMRTSGEGILSIESDSVEVL